MSAFVVDDVHIHALLTAGLTWRQHGPLRWQAPETEEPRGEQDFMSGEPWGPTAIETAQRRKRELTTETADAVGLMLLAQNYASVNYRYDDKQSLETVYKFKRLPGSPDPVVILKALDCYSYQSCESPDWEQTEAYAFCQSLRSMAIHRLRGYDSAPWDIQDVNIFQKVHTPTVEPPKPEPAKPSLSTTERAKAIRDTLKTRYGWTSRQVSVKADYFSMGSSIDVTIKDPLVSLEKVKAIAEAHEDISRCEITGEILSGGNRYIHVSYTSEALKAKAAPYLKAVEVAASMVRDNYLIAIAGTPFTLGVNSMGRWTLWGDRHLCECFDLESVAQQIACRIHQ